MTKKILFIFIFGLILRLSYVLFVPQLPVENDAGWYASLGRNIVNGQGYIDKYGKPDAYWSPGYPFFLSAVYKIFGINDISIRVTQSILSAILIILVYLICRSMFSAKIGLIAGGITSIYPAFISYSGVLLPQLLITFLITLLILLIMNFRGGILMSLVIGLIVGYSCLVRAEMLLMFFIIFTIRVFVSKDKRWQIFKSLIVMLIAMSFVVSMWTFRNYRVFNKLMLISSHYGDTMWLSTWKEEWLEWQGKEPLISILAGRSRTEAADDLFKAGINNIKENPFIYLRMCTKRLYRFWLTGHSNKFYFMTDSTVNYFKNKEYFISFIKFVMLCFNMLIVFLGFCGIGLVYKRSGQNRPLIHYASVPIVFFIILHFLTFATPRYSVPAMPFVIIFASCVIVCRNNLIEGCD